MIFNIIIKCILVTQKHWFKTPNVFKSLSVCLTRINSRYAFSCFPFKLMWIQGKTSKTKKSLLILTDNVRIGETGRNHGGKRRTLGNQRRNQQSSDGNPAASRQPCQEAGNNTTCLLAATGTYAWFVFFPLQISRFRLETQLVKSTGETKCHEEKNHHQHRWVGRRRGNQEFSPGILVRFIRGFLLKTLSWPLGFRKASKLSCKLAFCHYNRWLAAQAAKTMQEHHKRVLRASSLGTSLQSVCPLVSPELLNKVGIGNISVQLFGRDSLQAEMPAFLFVFQC